MIGIERWEGGVWQTQELLLAKGRLESDDCSGQTDCYNRTPTGTLSWCTLFELWNSGQISDVSHLRIFGCKRYMHIPHDKHHKLNTKAVEVTLVGYEPGSKGYRLWDKHTHSLRLSWDVTFDESMFPFKQGDEPRPALESPAPVICKPP